MFLELDTKVASSLGFVLPLTEAQCGPQLTCVCTFGVFIIITSLVFTFLSGNCHVFVNHLTLCDDCGSADFKQNKNIFKKSHNCKRLKQMF